MDMRFGMWNIGSLYRAGSLIMVSKDSGSIEGRWQGSGTAPAGAHTFFYGEGMRTMNWVQGFCT
jgi:hypothetical protein